MVAPEIGWRSLHTATEIARRERVDLASENALRWKMCAHCWGARRIVYQDEGAWFYYACPACLGVGESL